MNRLFLILYLTFCTSLLHAQVGINTMNPLGIFHIDPKGNTNAAGTSGIADDFIVKNDGAGGVGIGIGTIPAQGASVDLAAKNKGLALNTVALTGTGDLITVPSPVQGMLVFNTLNSSDLYPGICLFNAQTNKWEQMAFTKETNTVQIAVSISNVATTPVSPTVINNGEYAGVSIPFALLGSSTAGIRITEDGTYAFALNLVGSFESKDFLATDQSNMYLFMLRKSDMEIMDAAALGTLALFYPPKYVQSATAILASELKAGDELDFLICHNVSGGYPWTLFGGGATTAARYNKCSLSYWKL